MNIPKLTTKKLRKHRRARGAQDELQEAVQHEVLELLSARPPVEQGMYVRLVQLARAHQPPLEPQAFRVRLQHGGLPASRASELKAIYATPQVAEEFVNGLSVRAALAAARGKPAEQPDTAQEQKGKTPLQDLLSSRAAAVIRLRGQTEPWRLHCGVYVLQFEPAGPQNQSAKITPS